MKLPEEKTEILFQNLRENKVSLNNYQNPGKHDNVKTNNQKTSAWQKNKT